MNVMALPPGLRRFALHDLPRERWRNGKGWTRAVASGGAPDAAGAPAWRISLAEIDQAAPFSRFEGVDRIATLAQGGPVTLQAPDRSWALASPGDQAIFQGEWPLANLQPEGRAHIWNVMVRRGAVAADVRLHTDEPMALSAHAHALAWVVQGTFLVCDAAGQPLCTLDVDEGLHQHPVRPQALAATLTLRPMTPRARLLCTRLSPLVTRRDAGTRSPTGT